MRKIENNSEYQTVDIKEKLRLIMKERNIKQSVMAEYIDTTPSQFSKILKGTVQLSLQQLSNLATALGLREIDIYTFPEVFVSPTDAHKPVEAILQIRLQSDKRDKVLNLVLGENNLKILDE